MKVLIKVKIGDCGVFNSYLLNLPIATGTHQLSHLLGIRLHQAQATFRAAFSSLWDSVTLDFAPPPQPEPQLLGSQTQGHIPYKLLDYSFSV